jgi:hypothetical protein
LPAQHFTYPLTILEGIFYWWSPLGAYTCIFFLEKSQFRRQHLQDWHAKLHLYNVQRNVAPNLFYALGLVHNSLPTPNEQDKTYHSTPIWQFAPNLRKGIEKERKRRAARELEAARLKRAKEEAQAREEAQKREEQARVEFLRQEALKQKAEQEASRYVVEGEGLDEYIPTPRAELEKGPLPGPAPLPPHVSILDPNTDLRIQKLTQDAQIANLVAGGLGEPGSAPVLHAQSQNNLTTATLLELQICRKERAALEDKCRALEEKNHALEVSNFALTNRVGLLEQGLLVCQQALGLIPMTERAGAIAVPGPSSTTRPASPLLDMEKELGVDRGVLEVNPTLPASNPGKRARERSTFRTARGKPRQNWSQDRSVDPKRARPQGRDPSRPPQPEGTPDNSGNPAHPSNPGTGGQGSNYKGKHFNPNYRGRGQPKGKGNPNNRGGFQGNRRGTGPRK